MHVLNAVSNPTVHASTAVTLMVAAHAVVITYTCTCRTYTLTLNKKRFSWDRPGSGNRVLVGNLCSRFVTSVVDIVYKKWLINQ